MIESPLLRQQYWCCLPSFESSCYNDEKPCQPWLGKIVTSRDLDSKDPVYELSRFNRETGEPDLDSNATAYVRGRDLFACEAEARQYYFEAALRYTQSILLDLAEYQEAVSKYLTEGISVCGP